MDQNKRTHIPSERMRVQCVRSGERIFMNTTGSPSLSLLKPRSGVRVAALLWKKNRQELTDVCDSISIYPQKVLKTHRLKARANIPTKTAVPKALLIPPPPKIPQRNPSIAPPMNHLKSMYKRSPLEFIFQLLLTSTPHLFQISIAPFIQYFVENIIN